jgi:ribose transport system permease protein
MNPRASLSTLTRKPWLWSFLAALLIWLATIAFTGGAGAGSLLSGALSFSAFFVIVGIGQMFVITTGPGNIDLSIRPISP